MGHIASTDAELVEASRRGQHDAFGQLVTRYQDVVCAVSFSSTGNWALSEDVAQDTFIAAWRQLGQLREPSRLRSWLCGIARNLARKARKRGVREQVEDDVLDSAPAEGANPFDQTAQAEVDRVVREALARVPDTYRETLVLYYCENRSVREVADTLGIAEDAAMQRLSRGRRYLADGVTELVERSLRGSRGRREKTDLRPAVLAALPHVDPPYTTQGSNMLKLVLAASAVAAVGTTTVVAVRATSSTHATPVAATSPAPTQVAVNAPAATAPAKPAPAAAMHAAPMPALPAAATDAHDADAPRTIDKATRDRLGIETGPSRGPANAPVTIVIYQDLMCPFCGNVLGTLDQLFDEYPGKLRIVVKQFPVHKQAILAAEASLAADAQGKFWELHDAMFAHQEDLSRDAIVGYAKDAGLDVKAIADALDHHTYKDDLQKDIAGGKEIGVRGTPELVINGDAITGARPIESFRTAIDAALAAAPTP